MMDALFYLQVAGWCMAILADLFTVVMAIGVVGIAMTLVKKG